MRRNRLFTAITLAAALAMTACMQDELTDDTLPEGMYPLEIGSVTLSAEVSEQPWTANAPKTRVAENSGGNSSVWEIGDKFYVKFEGSDKVGTYRIVDATGRVEAVTPVYWPSASTEQTIIAWYAQIKESMMEISDQTNGLHYVIRAEQNEKYNRDASVLLEFKHQLAKVRVELNGLRKDNVTSVSLKDCRTRCINNQGNVTADSYTGKIQMHKVEGKAIFEANVLPGENISTVIVNSIESTLTSSITTEVGKVHKISLEVNAEDIPANATVITTENCNDINGNGNYVVSGSFNSTISVTGGSPNIYLDNATVSVGSGSGISITGGVRRLSMWWARTTA